MRWESPDGKLASIELVRGTQELAPTNCRCRIGLDNFHWRMACNPEVIPGQKSNLGSVPQDSDDPQAAAETSRTEAKKLPNSTVL